MRSDLPLRTNNDFKFAPVWVQNADSNTQNGGLWGILVTKWGAISTISHKGTFCSEFVSKGALTDLIPYTVPKIMACTKTKIEDGARRHVKCYQR